MAHNSGMATNYERAFHDRPEVYEAWGRLLTSVRDRMDLRRYELATFAAAQRLRSSYCSLAHGSILRERFGEDVRTLAGDRAGLSEVDVAVMELAEQVADDATSVQESDRQRLRDLGLTDGEIMDVILTAALRAFWTKTLDALGVEPDASYSGLDPELLEVLVVGRPIAAA
jgi:alkylhydroperoxidase family enzyme